MSSRPPREVTCYLDCVRKNPIRTVNGVPIDIPKKEYYKIVSWAGLIGLSYLLIGYASIEIILFSSSYPSGNLFDKLHTLLCTLGFQLLMPLGILMISSLNGPSAPLKPADRKISHVVMQVFAFILNLVGAILIFLWGSFSAVIEESWWSHLSFPDHAWFGAISLVLSGLSIMLGLIIFCKSSCSQRLKNFHACLGLSAYFISSFVFFTVVIDQRYREWHPLNWRMTYLVGIFISIYTVVVVTFSAYKLVRINRSLKQVKRCTL